jgi:hypothetical protein
MDERSDRHSLVIFFGQVATLSAPIRFPQPHTGARGAVPIDKDDTCSFKGAADGQVIRHGHGRFMLHKLSPADGCDA